MRKVQIADAEKRSRDERKFIQRINLLNFRWKNFSTVRINTQTVYEI